VIRHDNKIMDSEPSSFHAGAKDVDEELRHARGLE
jgi:hypothetical protein